MYLVDYVSGVNYSTISFIYNIKNKSSLISINDVVLFRDLDHQKEELEDFLNEQKIKKQWEDFKYTISQTIIKKRRQKVKGF